MTTELAELRDLVAQQRGTILALTKKNEALLDTLLLTACLAHRQARWKSGLPREAFV